MHTPQLPTQWGQVPGGKGSVVVSDRDILLGIVVSMAGYVYMYMYMNDQSLRLGKAKQLRLKTTPFFSREKEELPQAGLEPANVYMYMFTALAAGRHHQLECWPEHSC